MDTSAFVQSFREAAPYIHTFRGQTFVIGFGGELVESDRFSQLSHDINLLVSLGIRIVLVHGARPQVESLLALRGQTRQHHRGRRITDATAMDAVKYGIGYTRAEIEAQLSVALPDSPMAGANLRVAGGNYLVACPMGVLDGVDMQYSGAVRRVDTQAITQRLAAGELVLLSPIGYSPTGESFSLSMEEVAAHTATSLKADKLMYLVDTPTGVHSASGQLLREFSPEEGQAWLESSADHLPGEFRLCFASAIKPPGWVSSAATSSARVLTVRCSRSCSPMPAAARWYPMRRWSCCARPALTTCNGCCRSSGLWSRRASWCRARKK